MEKQRVDIELDKTILNMYAIEAAKRGISRRSYLAEVLSRAVDMFCTKDLVSYKYGFLNFNDGLSYDHEYSEEELATVNNPYKLEDNESI